MRLPASGFGFEILRRNGNSVSMALRPETFSYRFALIAGIEFLVLKPTMKTTLKAVAAIAALCSAALLIDGCGSGSMTVTPPVTITVAVSAKRAALTTGQQFSISATTTDSAGVTWSATSGSFSANTSANGAAVTYTAPSSAGAFTVTATSVTQSSVNATMTAYVTDLKGVTTYHNDLARDGSNTQEYALTPATVAPASFGKLFSCQVDGAIYAQPLWVSQLSLGGMKHNVVFVVTQHDSVYALDADTNPCVQLWKSSLLATQFGATAGELPVVSGGANSQVGAGYGDITPEVGITGTPVIDPASGTLYVVSKSVNAAGTVFYQRLHAIDVTTGNEKPGGPALIDGSITFPGTGDGGSTVSFNPQQQNQRPGLALVNGVVYVAWSSHEDQLPYYGWIAGFHATTLAPAGVLNISPNVQRGGIWMGGGAPSADAAGNLYVITGNAEFDAGSATPPSNDYGDSFLQLSSTLGVRSYFTPTDEESDNSNDADFGSGGSAIVLNVNSGSVKHLVIGGGKDGTLYLLNGDSMGGMGDGQARQYFNIGSGIFATGAFWNNNFYIATVNGPLAAYGYDSTANMFHTGVVSMSSSSYGFPGATPSVSASGTSNGVVWALDNGQYCTPQSPGCGSAVLHAYNATSLTTDLWNSGMTAGDAAGNAVKFTVPTVANGHVYVGTRGNNIGGSDGSTTVPGELDVYGLKSN